MSSFPKEYPSGKNSVGARIDQENGRLKLTLAKENEGRRPNWSNFDYASMGYWLISETEAIKIVDFLNESYTYSDDGRNPVLFLEAESSYYLDEPGAPRVYVNVEKQINEDVKFGIGQYEFLFMASEMNAIMAALKAMTE